MGIASAASTSFWAANAAIKRYRASTWATRRRHTQRSSSPERPLCFVPRTARGRFERSQTSRVRKARFIAQRFSMRERSHERSMRAASQRQRSFAQAPTDGSASKISCARVQLLRRSRPTAPMHWHVAMAYWRRLVSTSDPEILFNRSCEPASMLALCKCRASTVTLRTAAAWIVRKSSPACRMARFGAEFMPARPI